MYNKISLSKIIAYIAAAISGLVIILLLRRFPGIEHDSVLYLGQGLLHRYPNIFSQDIFFLHGGQSRYTIFPWLLGKMLGWMDPLPIFMLGTLIGLLFFVIASWYLLKTLLPDEDRYMAWIGVLCLPPMYGYTQVFSYSEAFFTMRTYAESLCLFAIAFITQFRWKSTLVCLVIAGLLHPLQTLVVLPIIWLWLVVKDRRWLHTLWLAVPIIFLGLVEIHPFDGLFEKADPFWLMGMRLSPHLFITLWEGNIFTWLAWDIFIFLLIYRYPLPYFCTWIRIIFITLILVMISSLILVDWMNLILPTGLQLWRIHWLAHWFAMASLALILLEHWRAKQWPQSVLLILIGQIVWCEVNWSWMGLALVYLVWPKLILILHSRLITLLSRLLFIGLILFLTKQIIFEFKFFDDSKVYYLNAYAVDHYILLCLPTIILGIYFLGLTLWNRSNKSKCFLLFFILLPTLLWGATQWDSRSQTRNFIDNLAGHSDIFDFQIPIDSQIYWSIDTPIISWYVLNRSHYYSHFQLSGQVFSRATAVEGYDRRLRLKDMNNELFECKNKESSIEEQHTCQISDLALYKTCSPSLPPDKYPPPFPAPPDYLVLPFAQPQTALGQWMGYYLYSCAGLMEELQVEMEEKADNISVELSS